MTGSLAPRAPRNTLLPLTLTLLAWLAPTTLGHGLMSCPRQRGLLNVNSLGLPTIKPDAPADYCPHCLNGGGVASIAANSPKGLWTPYEPTNANFRFRDDHGLCGDPLGASQPHMAPSGSFVANVTLATFERADYIDFELHVSAHHNGFFEFFVCSLDCHGGPDISRKCFERGCCHKLMRVPHRSCQSGHDRVCGPVDPKHPGRWVLPPRDARNPESNWYGGRNKKMRYALPETLTCERCVVHWAWTTANSCNPPGYADYAFPQKWAGLPGDGGAVGGVNKQFAQCGSSTSQFPEEFWSCSENVRIVPPNKGRDRTTQVFRDGEMNIEGPGDATGDQLLAPLHDPHTAPSQVGDAASSADKPAPVTAPATATTTTTTAAMEPASTEAYTSPARADEPAPQQADAGVQALETPRNGSEYDLYAHVPSYDTGVCTAGDAASSYCEACLDLGYGTRKCLWCRRDGRGREHCLHEKPSGS